jgi:hypothetical protein
MPMQITNLIPETKKKPRGEKRRLETKTFEGLKLQTKEEEFRDNKKKEFRGRDWLKKWHGLSKGPTR